MSHQVHPIKTTADVYHYVIDDVIESMEETFAEAGLSNNVLRLLKKEWAELLASTRAVMPNQPKFVGPRIIKSERLQSTPFERGHYGFQQPLLREPFYPQPPPGFDPYAFNAHPQRSLSAPQFARVDLDGCPQLQPEEPLHSIEPQAPITVLINHGTPQRFFQVNGTPQSLGNENTTIRQPIFIQTTPRGRPLPFQVDGQGDVGTEVNPDQPGNSNASQEEAILRNVKCMDKPRRLRGNELNEFMERISGIIQIDGNTHDEMTDESSDDGRNNRIVVSLLESSGTDYFHGWISEDEDQPLEGMTIGCGDGRTIGNLDLDMLLSDDPVERTDRNRNNAPLAKKPKLENETLEKLKMEKKEEIDESHAEVPPESDQELCSDDDLGDSEDDFNCEDVIICQFEKVLRNRQNWRFDLKDGIMHVDGRDYCFQKCYGEAEWGGPR